MNYDIEFLLIFFEVDDGKGLKQMVSTESCFDIWTLKVIHPGYAVFHYLLKHNLKRKIYKSFLRK